jgi:hypothetical protein
VLKIHLTIHPFFLSIFYGVNEIQVAISSSCVQQKIDAKGCLQQLGLSSYYYNYLIFILFLNSEFLFFGLFLGKSKFSAGTYLKLYYRDDDDDDDDDDHDHDNDNDNDHDNDNDNDDEDEQE